MQEKTKTQADRQLIKTLLAIDPIDWARYPDGTLTFISPTGQKFKYSQRLLDSIKQDIADSKAAAKKAAAKKSAAKKSAAKKSTAKKAKSVDLNAEVDAAVSFKKDAPGAVAE